ncbi:SPOR domain-containing protein [Flavobacterium ardleyense]|uniref:SPOR domain-containing protein n=1 Tax=Flavobacterium ardleyense TaxID=2038737 RepID=UPI00298D04AB|nr:SPOR domain-containing protein [Flavobacterium ardleyense]
MKQNTIQSFIYSIMLMTFFNTNSSAQQGSVTLSQDANFEQLLNEKRKINSSLIANNRYKIQIFNGDNASSKKQLLDFKREFRQYESTIVFSTPIYKVWVGSFKSRIEAERNLEILKKKYPKAFLIKPN